MKPTMIDGKLVPSTRPTSGPRKILPLGDPPPQHTPSANSLAAATAAGNRQVLRVNRACNACRKQKMRCEGPENPPCVRCKATGQPCVFEKVQKTDGSDGTSLRIADLETKWTSIESTLGDVLKELRDVKSSLGQNPPGSAGGFTYGSAPSPAPSSPHDLQSSSYSPVGGASPPLPFINQGPYRQHSRSFGSNPSGSQLPPIDQIYSARKLDSPLSAPLPPPSPLNRFDEPHGFPIRGVELLLSQGRRRTNPSNIYSANNSGDEDDLPNAALAAPISVVNDIASAHPVSTDEDYSSASESTAEVEGQFSASPRPRRLSEKRKRRASSIADQSRARFKGADGRPRNLDFTQYGSQAQQQAGDTNSLSSVASTSSLTRSRRRRAQDVVDRGFLTEAEAHNLYKTYFSGCHRLLAVFDQRLDTFDSIKQRSPFLLCALLMVGAKVRDGPAVSDLQALLLHEATELAKDRVFESKGKVEDVQALLLLAGWSHSMGGVGWLTAGHAIRLAVELGIHKALPKLERLLKADDADPETHRPLITAARTWLALYVFEYQISFGTGRPAMMKGDTAITNGKDILLRHPLSIPTDARLVSTCELLTRQNAIHQRLDACLERNDDVALHRALQDAQADIDSWLDEWDVRMSSFDLGAISVLDCLFQHRLSGVSQPTAGFFRSSAAIQRAYANLFHNCIALRGLRTAADARSMSSTMRSIALQAIQSAKECIDICLNNAEYRKGLKYAVAYTHTCAAFAGAFLLRFARLFPADLDLGETTDTVGALATVLSEVPAISFGIWLRKMLNHTRQRALYGRRETESAAPLANPAVSKGQHNPSRDQLGMVNDVSTTMPPPLPPVQLPNSQPFVPLSASSSSMTVAPYVDRYGSMARAPLARDDPNIQGPGLTLGANDDAATLRGDQRGRGEIPFTDSAASMLQGFLGDGHDWPPWLTTSMIGDLDPGSSGTGATDLSFVWNAPFYDGSAA